jgi:GMP synthase (glutamine-hydrolysing)
MTPRETGTEREILIVQHVASEEPGLVVGGVAGMGLATRIVRPDRGEPIPKSAFGRPGLIVLGGPMGVYESNRFPNLKAEIALLADAMARGVPVLGVCLGAQLLAAAAGARVFRGETQEIGWLPVRLSDAGRGDPVLGLLPDEAKVFHWHTDTFDLPTGATLLASSALYPHQAFHLGPRAYGVQFHPEMTVELVDRWVSLAGPDAAALGGAEGTARARDEARRRVPSLAPIVGGMMASIFAGVLR